MDGFENTQKSDISFKYCPKCGSSDISPSVNGDISNTTTDSHGIDGGVGISGVRIHGQKSHSSSKVVHSELPRKYVCVDCGYKFDNGDFLTIFNKVFIPSELFPNSYKILTGEKDFQELVTSVYQIKERMLNRLSNAQIDKPLNFTIKMFGRKYVVTTRKSFDSNESKVWYILEKLSLLEGS